MPNAPHKTQGNYLLPHSPFTSHTKTPFPILDPLSLKGALPKKHQKGCKPKPTNLTPLHSEEINDSHHLHFLHLKHHSVTMIPLFLKLSSVKTLPNVTHQEKNATPGGTVTFQYFSKAMPPLIKVL